MKHGMVKRKSLLALSLMLVGMGNAFAGVATSPSISQNILRWFGF